MSNSHNFCYDDAPEDLKQAVRDLVLLREWIKSKDDTALESALGQIFIHHVSQRELISEELLKRRQKSLIAKVEELKKPHWSTFPTFIIVVIALIVAILAWLFPRAPDVPKEESKTVSAPVPVLPLSQPVRTEAPVPVVAPPSPKADAAATPATQPKP